MKSSFWNLTRRGAVALLAAGLALAVSHEAARADVLVLFKNGKALRAKTATRDGKWLRCEFEDKNFIAVPASGVLSIEEAAAGSTAGEPRPNQMAAGTGGGYVPGPRGGDIAPPPELAPAAQVAAPEDDPSVGLEEELAYQRQKAMEARSAAARRGNNRGIPIQPGQGLDAQNQQGLPPGLTGLQPLNQAGTPFQSRRLNSRRGVPGDNLQERANQNE